MFPYILLNSLLKLEQERTPMAIYHILTGKRSSQSLQDVHIFHLKKYFGIYKSLHKDAFESGISSLKQDGLAVKQDGELRVTNAGKTYLEQEKVRIETNQFKGLEYDRVADVFFERLTLFIQLAANLLSGHKSFIPIVDKHEVLRWTKTFYQRNKPEMKACFDRLYQELYRFLLTLSEREATVFVDRLTGYNRYGLSKYQIQKKHQLSEHDIHLLMVLNVHKLITWIQSQHQENLFIAQFLEGINAKELNTASAEKTYALLEKGLTIDEISKVRKLKASTIYDHIIEIAYRNTNFDLSPYMDKQAFDEIAVMAEQLDSKKLKVINEALGGKYTYFQIRLVIAVKQFV